MRRKHITDPGDGADSIADSSTDDNSRNSRFNTYSDRNSSSGLELSELAIHTLLVETRARDLDREEQKQEWNGRTVLRPIAYGSKVLSDTEMKYGAPKAEMFAVVTIVEKYRAYLGSAPFKL